MKKRDGRGGGGEEVNKEGSGGDRGEKRRLGEVGWEGGSAFFKTQFLKMGKYFKKKAKKQTTLHVHAAEFKYSFELTLATPNRSHCCGLR